MTDKELVEYLCKWFYVDSGGTLHRKDRKNSAGSYDKDGYLIVKIKGKQYKAHRLVYALHYGLMPIGVIDHINGIRTDNRIENLRCVTQADNVANTVQSRNALIGEYGIYEDRSTKGLKRRYSFHFSGKTYRFKTIEEAKKAKDALWKEKYGNTCEAFQNSRRAESPKKPAQFFW